jgi:ATP-binding cassette subfamily B protein
MTEIILLPNEVVDVSRPEPVVNGAGALEFRDVTFSYRDQRSREALLEHFNVVIPAGQKVGLVGPSGGGKTTITKLLLRLMDIHAGEILVDGQNIARVAQNCLRATGAPLISSVNI